MDKFFLHFEKVATTLHWPLESHTMLLQSILVGKVREVYLALSLEQSADYEVVKREILKAYELVPEAYHQQFREIKCKEGQTYMVFACLKKYSLTGGALHNKLVIVLKGLNSSSF